MIRTALLILGLCAAVAALILCSCEPNGCVRQSDCPEGQVCDETLHCSAPGAPSDAAAAAEDGSPLDAADGNPTSVCWTLAHDAYSKCLPENVDSTNRASTLACVDNLAVLASSDTQQQLHALAQCFLTDCGAVGRSVLGGGDFQHPCKACERARLACLNN